MKHIYSLIYTIFCYALIFNFIRLKWISHGNQSPRAPQIHVINVSSHRRSLTVRSRELTAPGDVLCIIQAHASGSPQRLFVPIVGRECREKVVFGIKIYMKRRLQKVFFIFWQYFIYKLKNRLIRLYYHMITYKTLLYGFFLKFWYFYQKSKLLDRGVKNMLKEKNLGFLLIICVVLMNFTCL